MFEKKSKVLVLFGVLASLIAGSTQAELLEYTFVAPDGTQRFLSPDDIYANPTGNITFALSAGIDRKVRISIIRPDGAVVSTATSHLLGATDRITVEDKSYYGAKLQLSSPAEGNYQLKSEILSAQGTPVQTDTFHLVVDVTPPQWTGEIARVGGFPVDVLVTNGWGESGSAAIYVGGATDNSDFLVKATFFAISESGNGARVERPARLSAGGRVEILLNDVVNNEVMPIDRHYYRIGFDIYDKAGNKATISRLSARDSVVPPFFVSVFNPNTRTWQPYTANMMAYENPVRFRIGRLKTDHTDFNDSRFGWSTGYTNQDETFVYNYVTQTYPFAYYYTVFKTVANSVRNFYPSQHPVTLANGVEEGPKGVMMSYHVAYDSINSNGTKLSAGWHNNDDNFYVSAPVLVDKVRVQVQPRSYHQLVTMSGSAYRSCMVPPGETYCDLTTAIEISSGRSYSPLAIYIQRHNPNTNSNDMPIHFSYFYRYWDMNPPTIEYATASQNHRYIYMRTVDLDRINNWQLYMWDTKVFECYAINVDTGERINLPGLAGHDITVQNYNTTEARFDYRNLPDGMYRFEVEAVDTYQNKASMMLPDQVTVDNVAPTLTVSISNGSSIQSLDDVLIDLSDTVDPDPKLTSIALTGGPAQENVQLSWRDESKGRFRLEYPVMFPSLKEGESYMLTISGQDAQGNIVRKVVDFDYQPRQVMLADGMDGKVMIPAVTHEFIHADGSRIIETEPLVLSDGSVVTGLYDVFATLRSDAQVPLAVNGVRIEPGQTMSIMSQHDFGASGGRLSIPIKPSVPNIAGSSSLLVMTSAPNSPILVMDISTWKASAKLSAESWLVRQVIDPVKIYALPGVGVPCRFTTKPDEAMAADPIRDPVCLLEWDRTPDEAEQTTQENNGLKVAGLVGQAVSIGEQPVEYSLYLFSGDGSKVKVGSGSQNLTVKTAHGSVGYTPGEDVAQINRIIEDVGVSFEQNLGPDCSLTLSAERAKREASTKPMSSTGRTCLFEWQQIPDGLIQDQFSESPLLSGTLAENGDHPLGWRVSIYARNGTRVTLADQTFNIEAVDPPAPTIELSSKYNFKDNIYMVPMSGDYLGDAVISSERADLDVAISRNTEILDSETFPPGWGATNKVYRRINTDERGLWEETTYKVKAAYNKVPDTKTEVTYRVVSAPLYSIKPIVEVEGNTAIDTQALPVKVLIRDQYKADEAYNANTMGVWKVRLIRQMAYNETEALTDFAEASNGEANFSVDLSGVDTSSVRIAAEAVLVSPVEGYTRTELSTRPAFMTVLHGGAIGADVVARKLSGKAPFTTVFKASLHDRKNYRSTGDVVWETSTDGGSSWSQYIPEERYKFQLVKTFEKGEYKIRAKLVNRNSGAEAYTETVDVIAYDKPEVEVQGPMTLFVGSTGTYTAKMTLENESVPAHDVVVEWSTDAGNTYSQTGPSITLSSNEDTRIRLWTRVRAKEAPADDSYAYEIAKSAVEFRAVKAPRTYVTGPRVIETGKKYVFKAETRLPYRGMDVQVKGFFTLPDGTQVEGDTAEYVPTETDLTKSNIETTYSAWIEGYRDQGAEATHSLRSRVWQYVWPRFGVQMRKTADVAPATITASVRPIGFNGRLEEPSYEWVLPDGAVVHDQRQPTVRAFVINQPGEHTLKVTVSDARGHESVLEQPITIGQAEPYAIDLQYSASNKHEREPLNILLRPYISGGHPRDRIAKRVYTVDDQALESTGYYGRATLDAGEHTFKLKITSEMGHEAEGKVNIDVAENKLPTCDLSSRETIGSWIVYANCEDTDGRMKSYQWTVAGEQQSISSDRITISKGSYQAMPTVTMIGVDDSGGKSGAVTLH